jgi:DinB superfamily
MKKISIVTLMMMLMSVVLFAQEKKEAPPAKDTGHAMSKMLGVVEWEVVGAAEAMPDEKYNFKPTEGAFTDVRTFGEQFRHIGFVNYVIGSMLTGEKNPLADAGKENGPDLKTKAEIVKQLKDSFAYLHKALETMNASNEMDVIDMFGQKSPKINAAALGLAHPFDHYGQAVEYLRMNNIIPPASRPQPKK